MFLFPRFQSSATCSVPKFTIIMCIIILCMITAKLPMLIKGAARGGDPQQVPCVFFLGDSQIDNGNNNFLITRAKVDYLPYGIDYPDGPTGRFSNGKNLPDFLAEFLGFDKPIPPFATAAAGPQILKGINYGSGGSGILDESGFTQGGRISMNEQIMHHGQTVHRIGERLGNARKGKEHLGRCLYCVVSGSNDYLNNYFVPQKYNPTLSSRYSPPRFAQLLAKRFSLQLRTLYSLGARRIAIFGVGQLGCVPQVTSTMINHSSSSSSTGCVDSFNNDARLFNNALPPLVDTLNRDLPDAKFILINATSISRLDPSTTGIKIGNVPCCVVKKETGLCQQGSEPCRNRNEYAFWDNYHPTENAYRIMATRAYNAESPSDAYPTDIRRLIQK